MNAYERTILRLLAGLIIVVEEAGGDDAKLAVGYAKAILDEEDENA